jgi:ArsR family metal-binding transcriptional regulator
MSESPCVIGELKPPIVENPKRCFTSFPTLSSHVFILLFKTKVVNDVWDERVEIVPESTSRDNLQPLELHRPLLRTNCKTCGQASRFNFAEKLAAGQIDLDKCEPLFVEIAYGEQRAEIESPLVAKRPLL